MKKRNLQNEESDNHKSKKNASEESGFSQYHQKLAEQHNQSVDERNEQLDLDFRQYLRKKNIAIDADVFSFWTSQLWNTPVLANFALKKLSIVSPSVPCERLFSEVNALLTDARSRISPKHVDQVVFLRSIPKKDWRLFNLRLLKYSVFNTVYLLCVLYFSWYFIIKKGN